MLLSTVLPFPMDSSMLIVIMSLDDSTTVSGVSTDRDIVAALSGPPCVHDVTLLNIWDWDYIFHQKPLETLAVFSSPVFPVFTWLERTCFIISVPCVQIRKPGDLLC